MSALPTQMIDRWQHRSDPAPGDGTVYWHMPMDGYPQVVGLARKARQRLAPFDGLHMTPLERLHMTTMNAGPAADFTEDQLDRMATTAADLLDGMPPAAVTVGRILYHPEAIMLGVSPAKALLPIRNAAITATRLATGRDYQRDDLERWVPQHHDLLQHGPPARDAPHRRARREPPPVPHRGQRSQPHRPARPRTPLAMEHHGHHPPCSLTGRDAARA